MTKPDYTAFDALLLDKIKSGKNTFRQLEADNDLKIMAKPFCSNTRTSTGYPQPEWRIVDRRLQALRKSSKITHAGGAWRIFE